MSVTLTEALEVRCGEAFFMWGQVSFIAHLNDTWPTVFRIFNVFFSGCETIEVKDLGCFSQSLRVQNTAAEVSSAVFLGRACWTEALLTVLLFWKHEWETCHLLLSERKKAFSCQLLFSSSSWDRFTQTLCKNLRVLCVCAFLWKWLLHKKMFYMKMKPQTLY